MSVNLNVAGGLDGDWSRNLATAPVISGKVS